MFAELLAQDKIFTTPKIDDTFITNIIWFILWPPDKVSLATAYSSSFQISLQV
jgi:hypothetical protein